MEEDIKILIEENPTWKKEKAIKNLRKLLTRYKQLEEENKNYQKGYYSLTNKIERKIDKFDYEFEKAKRKNDKDRADYYWDLIRNFKKLLEEE